MRAVKASRDDGGCNQGLDRASVSLRRSRKSHGAVEAIRALIEAILPVQSDNALTLEIGVLVARNRESVSRVAVSIALIAAAIGVVILGTGGFGTTVLGWRVSAHKPLRAAAVPQPASCSPLLPLLDRRLSGTRVGCGGGNQQWLAVLVGGRVSFPKKQQTSAL